MWKVHRECRRTYWCTVDGAQVCAECLIFGSYKGHTGTAMVAQEEELKVEEEVVVPLQELTLG